MMSKFRMLMIALMISLFIFTGNVYAGCGSTLCFENGGTAYCYWIKAKNEAFGYFWSNDIIKNVNAYS